jgi:cysteinyl-tRNA synthetase
MAIRFYNTLTREKEVFTPLKKGRVGFYACGPTVYWNAHLGNFRTYLFEDLLRRILEYNGYRVKFVMNFTDVGHLTSDADTGEDKIEAAAKKEGKTARQIADFYIAAFKKDAAALNILPPTIYARATDHIKEQITLVKILEKNGFTYKTSDGVYFDTSKISDYGRLAKLDLEGQKSGARVPVVSDKKNPHDFALWKLTPAGVKRLQEWDSSWGKGFPGWHLECSAMSQKYLGRQFDIHAGAIDLIPVHHTNEIAQSQAAFGQTPARFWLHGEFLLLDNNKISKSAGDNITVKKITEKFNPLAFRYLTLTAHYRSPLNLTWESLEGAQAALNRLKQTVRDLKKSSGAKIWLLKLASSFGVGGKKTSIAVKNCRKYQESFLEAINDDLDLPRALALIWEMIGDPALPPAIKLNLLLKFDRVFGLGLEKISPLEPPAKIKKFAEQREQLRQEKKWAEADKLRIEMKKAGWLIEDTPQGPQLKSKN